jgi:sRNA-binding regulator protein Hfq
MGHLVGLDDYLAENYEVSVFDTAMTSGKPWEFHLHGHSVLRGVVLENRKWDITLDIAGKEKEELQKIQVNYLHPAELSESVKPLIKTDKKVESMNLEPILSPHKRYFVKNKSLFPLMKEKEVLLSTLLDGEVLRGIVTEFSRYDVTVSMKGGVLVTILRHAVYDLRNKKGRCFLKSFQDKHRDWEKSPLFIN